MDDDHISVTDARRISGLFAPILGSIAQPAYPSFESRD